MQGSYFSFQKIVAWVGNLIFLLVKAILKIWELALLFKHKVKWVKDAKIKNLLDPQQNSNKAIIVKGRVVGERSTWIKHKKRNNWTCDDIL